MTIWFSSDWHFGHANIIRYANRPFTTTAEMDQFLIDRHNEYVKPNDHYYHLGDVTMERDNRGDGLRILRALHGHGRLILGNHDHYAMKHYLAHFEKVMAMQRIDNIWFTHVPVHPTSIGSNLANVHGHIHDAQSPPAIITIDKQTQKVTYKPYINISVEVTGYRPISLDEVKSLIKKACGEYEGEDAQEISEGSKILSKESEIINRDYSVDPSGKPSL